MPTALITHPDCLLHDNGSGHPEKPERLSAILKELEKPEYASLIRIEAPLAIVDQIGLVHNRRYIDNIFARIPAKGIIGIEGETGLAAGSGNAALRAAGSFIAAVDLVMRDKATNAFCAVRPPGHHAEHAEAMGFCLFNNIAIGAEHALRNHKVQRIAILDFDVHHGNGTQEWAEKNPNVLFCSSHQWPLYPGSGLADDHGPHGNIVNIPLSRGTDGEAFRQAMQTLAFPTIDNFKPELIFMSAGFDAHANDPLAGLNLTEEDFFWITAETCRLARRHSQGRIVSTLEGGYDLPALAASAGAHVKALMEG